MSIRILDTQADLDRFILPVLKKNGSEIPAPGCYVAAVEFDDAGEVVAYQLLQNAVFLEGLWARDRGAHLLSVYRAANEYATNKLHASATMTMTRQDDAGNRIGKIAEKLGFERMNWNVFRRKICQQRQ